MSYGEVVKYYSVLGRPRRGQVLLRDCDSHQDHRVSLSPFIYFAEGDRLRITYGVDGAIVRIDKLLHVPGRDNAADEVVVFPYYAHTESLPLMTGTHIPVIFKEVTTNREFEQLRFLEQFHYLQAKPSWGRQVYLIATPERDEVLGTPLPGVLGCVVLTSPSLLSGPRNNLLGWNDREVLKHHIDRVVRIARVIVHPEFRGLRLGTKLVQHSLAYCRERWNVKGKKAWFVETVAEMSRYHPFFVQGGLSFIGETKAEDAMFFFDDNPKRLGTDQGEGQVMASIRRFKQKIRTQRPYLIASLLPPDDPLSVKIRAASSVPPASSDVSNLVQDQLPHPITFDNVTAGYGGRTVWEEPEELNSQWLEASQRFCSDLGAYMAKLSHLVSDLLRDELWAVDRQSAHQLLPILRRMATKVRDGCSCIEMMASEGRHFTSGLSSTLEAVLRHRDELLEGLARARVMVENELKDLNQAAEALRLSGTHLDSSLVKRRSFLNEVRTRMHAVESKLELGAVTAQQRWVTEAFGVRPGQRTTAIQGFNLEVWPGSIVLVIGPSGSGKSSLLSLLDGTLSPSEGNITPSNLAEYVSVLDLDFDPSRPLIDLVGKDEREAIYLLNHVGLAESHLYMKRRDQLSHGQRYRAAFAQMLAHRRPVWVADEFCAFLDPVTTLTLCKGIRKLVRDQKITFIAACAKEDYVRDALKPDIVIRINAGGHIWPAPKHHHWLVAPSCEDVLAALRGSPDNLSPKLSSWLRQTGLLEEDPGALAGLRWTSAGQRLMKVQEESPDQFSLVLAEHLWSCDWIFHRVWNRITHSEADCYGDEWAAGERRSQVRYRETLARSLYQVCR